MSQSFAGRGVTRPDRSPSAALQAGWVDVEGVEQIENPACICLPLTLG